MSFRILVTGGCGFIGSHMANFLEEKGHAVVVIDRIDYCSRRNSLNSSIPFYQVDINDRLAVYKILQANQIDTIFHFAAQTHVDLSFSNVGSFCRDNIKGTLSLLELIKDLGGQIRRFIHVSTDEVYGQYTSICEKGCSEESVLKPTNPYSASKVAAEALVQSYISSYQLPIIITRSNNVYGPGQYPDKIIGRFTCQALRNIPLTIQGDGTAKRTFLYINDIVRAFYLILTNGKVGEIYNIGTEDEYSVTEIADLICREIGRSTRTVPVPDRTFNDCRYKIDCQKIRDLGWRPQVPFLQGLRTTIAWYADQAWVSSFPFY
jgi:UDP-glucose 4,6-dehydratase